MKIYRGLSQPTPAATVDNHLKHTPRLPVHTPMALHRAADAWFYDRFGVKARSECVFCTPDIHVAYGYVTGKKDGSVVEVIPEGAYSLIFSDQVQDFFIATHEDNIDEGKVHEWLERQRYAMVHSLADLPEGLDSEIMLDCQRYTIAPVNH